MAVPAKIATKARSFSPGTIMEFFLLDTSSIKSRYTGAPGPIFAFHNSNNQGVTPIDWQSISYQPFPIESSGWEFTQRGQFPRPQITFSNVGALGSAMLREFRDLHGASVTRKRTLYSYLDGQTGADPTQEFPNDIYLIDHKVVENKTLVTLELASNVDVQDIEIPGRPLTANACPFWYRSGDGCDYAGAPKTDAYGAIFVGPLVDRGLYNPVTTYQAKNYAYLLVNGVRDYRVCMVNGTIANLTTGEGLFSDSTHWTPDVCQKLFSSCTLRFGADLPLPFGGFPAIIRAPQG